MVISRLELGEKDNYHHGSLREALLAASLQFIREHGAEKLSLRAIAREIGVSQAAPYRHFSDKEDILVALATQGYTALAGRLEIARREAYGPVEALRECGIAYVEFALDHPEHYRLMFSTRVLDQTKFPDYSRESLRVLKILKELVEGGVSAGLVGLQHTDLLSLSAWSMVHGLASLLIDDKLKSKANDKEQALMMADAVCQVLLDGIVHRD